MARRTGRVSSFLSGCRLCSSGYHARSLSTGASFELEREFLVILCRGSIEAAIVHRVTCMSRAEVEGGGQMEWRGAARGGVSKNLVVSDGVFVCPSKAGPSSPASLSKISFNAAGL